MKICVLAVLLLIMLSGCQGQEDEVYEVSDRFFATQMHGILFNSDEYMGRTIRFTGMFFSSQWGDPGQPTETFYYVGRFGEECCAPGDFMGLEVYLGDIPVADDFSWVSVTGVLGRKYIQDFGEVIYLHTLSMEEVDIPGL